MPKLARFYNIHSGKRELVIIIQALNILNDSIVGFRYLNGGNGSAHLREVTFLSVNEINKISSSQFINLTIKIDAKPAKIWEVLTKDEYSKPLQAIFDKKNILETDWKKYYGSSDRLVKDIEKLGSEKFTREILYLCKTRGETNYMEVYYQINEHVLLRNDKFTNYLN